MDRLFGFRIVDVRTNTLDRNVIATFLDENTHVDAAQIVAVEAQHAIEVVVQIDLIEVAQGCCTIWQSAQIG